MTKQEFLDRITPLIVKIGHERGYSIVSPVIAQAIIESGWGQSGLAKYNNFFGLKCGSKWKGGSVNMKTKEEYTPGKLTSIKDNFRTYANMEEGVKGYYDFINTKRYANLKTATTPLQYCQNLKADGYATSSSYVNTLMNTINTLGLAKYDGIETTVQDSTDKGIWEIVNEVIQGKWGNGQDRKDRLTAAGYNYREIQDAVNRRIRGY